MITLVDVLSFMVGLWIANLLFSRLFGVDIALEIHEQFRRRFKK